MSYTFETAEPIQTPGAGRKSLDNPFVDAVKGIAGKTNEKTKKPLALAFFEEHNEEDKNTIQNRIGRLLTDAGRQCEPQVTVRRLFEVQTNKDGIVIGSKVTFWPVKLQTRPRTASPAPTETPAVDTAAK